MKSFLPVVTLAFLSSAACGDNAADSAPDGGDVTRDASIPDVTSDTADATGAGSFSKSAHVAVGSLHACAILDDQSVACWGRNFRGEAGVSPEASKTSSDSSTLYVLPAARVDGITGVVQLSAGTGTTYALTELGDVYQWGIDFGDQTTAIRGDGPSYVPGKIVGLDHVVEVRTGGEPTCARKDDGTVWCWGLNLFKNVGVPTPGGSPGEVLLPTQVQGITDAVEIAVSDNTSCARHADGSVSCWGNVAGSIDPTPRMIAGIHSTTQIAVAGGAMYAVMADKTVMGWGGISPDNPNAPPTLIAGLQDVRAIAAQTDVTCAIEGDHSVWCWGENGLGELGQGRPAPSDAPIMTPLRVPNLTATEIAVGVTSSCAKRSAGDFVCFGQSIYGSMGGADPGANIAAAPRDPVSLP